MNQAVVDILMATHNGEDFLASQIDSILKQSKKEFRLLISDDNSSDSTLRVIEEKIASDSRVELVSYGIKYGGARDNFLSLLPYVESNYAMFCDQDDVWDTDKIEITLSKMKEVEREYGQNCPILVFTDMRVVDRELNIIESSFERGRNPDSVNFSRLLAENIAAGCTMMANSRLIQCAKQVKCNDGIIMHDWWFMLIAAALGHIGYLNRATSSYRQHESNAAGYIKNSVFRRPRIEHSVPEEWVQAAAFQREFKHTLKAADLLMLNELRSLSIGSGCGLAHLVRSKAWPKSPRKRVGFICKAMCISVLEKNAR